MSDNSGIFFDPEAADFGNPAPESDNDLGQFGIIGGLPLSVEDDIGVVIGDVGTTEIPDEAAGHPDDFFLTDQEAVLWDGVHAPVSEGIGPLADLPSVSLAAGEIEHEVSVWGDFRVPADVEVPGQQENSTDSLLAQADDVIRETENIARKAHAGEPSFGKSRSSEDALLKQADDLIRDTRQMVEAARADQNAKLVSLGLTPMTGDLAKDLDAEIHNVMTMSDRASRGDAEAEEFIKNWESSNKRNIAQMQGDIHRMETQMEVDRVNERVRAGNDWLHEKSMEREELSQAESHRVDDSRGFLDHIDRSKEHRAAAEDADRKRRELS